MKRLSMQNGDVEEVPRCAHCESVIEPAQPFIRHGAAVYCGYDCWDKVDDD